MSIIETIPEDQAQGDIAESYEKFKDAKGSVANILKLQSLSPHTLEAHYAFYKSLMFARGPLTRSQRELIAVAVSQENECHY